jgi:GGDEF domain-containing protein
VSISPDDASTMDELLKMADKAMYHAKLDAKSSFSFWHSADV